jgi:hypothetical protein
MKHYGVTSWSSINKAKLIYEMIQEQYAGKKNSKSNVHKQTAQWTMVVKSVSIWMTYIYLPKFEPHPAQKRRIAYYMSACVR